MNELLNPPSRRRLFLLLLGLVAYGPVIRIPFLWDDHVMIEGNANLGSWSWQHLRHDFSTDVFEGRGDGYYRPAQTVMNRIDATLWGERPVGFHITNLLAHLLNALLLEALLVTLGFAPMVCFIAASLFVVHPIGVEELMIIAGRAELFGLTFTLSSLLLLVRAWDPTGERPTDVRSLAGSLACFAVALLFKESAVVIPALGVLLLWYRGVSWKRMAPVLTLFALIIPYMWLRVHMVGMGVPLPEGSLTGRFMSEVFPHIAWRYFFLILWPWNLHSHRMVPHISFLWPLELLGTIALLTILAQRRSRFAWLLVGWYFISLAPKIPVMMYGHFMLDHWAYPAAIAVFLPLAVFFAYGWDHPEKVWLHRLAAGYMFILILYALMTRLNLELRSTDEKMYRWALRFTRSTPVKHNLAVTLLQQGRAAEAIPFFEEVRAVYPTDIENNYALSKSYFLTGHPKIAILLLKQILLQNPQYAPARATLQSLPRINTLVPKPRAHEASDPPAVPPPPAAE